MAVSDPVMRAIQRVASSDLFARVAPWIVPPLDKAVSRITRGRVMLSQGVLPSIVLTTTGARSGQQRRTPLATVPANGDFYVVASNFGGEKHPAWSYNLIANPEATITVGGTDRRVTAELLDPVEKEAVWSTLTAQWPPYDRYVERSGRDLRVFRLVTAD